MANDTAFRAGRFLQGQVTQDFSGCGPGAAVTATIDCNPSAIDACPTMKGCQTVPPTGLCTPVPEFCPTACGPDCQTPQPNCTSINCTQVGPQCPEPTIGITCTSVSPQCPRETNVVLDCTFGCTQFGPACPVTPFPQCANVTVDASCQTVKAQQAVGAAGGGGVNITLLTVPVWACGPTPATRCFICPPMTFDYNCQLQQQAAGGAAAAPGTSPTPATRCFVCPPRTFDYNCQLQQQAAGGAGAAPNTAATVCTQFGPGCHTYPNGDCTFFGCGPRGGGGHTAATVCTQFGQQCQSAVDACPTRLCAGAGGGGGQTAATVCTQFGQQCQSAVDACPTRLCAGGGGAGAVGAAAAPGTWPTPQTRCFVCDPAAARGGAVTRPNTAATVCTQFGPGCHTYPNGDCTFFGCGPGGGGGRTAATVCTQFGQQCQSAVDACPTRLCNQQAVGTWPTPMTRCFIC